MQGQVRLDGRIVNTIYVAIPGFGKIPLDWEGDRPRPGDFIVCGDNRYVFEEETYGASYNHDGVAKDEATLVYKVQGVRPFRYDGIMSAAEAEAAWKAKVQSA